MVHSTTPQTSEAALPMQYGISPPTFHDKYEERQYVRERLALAYRVVMRECHCEGASGHLTVRDPVEPSAFWVNPYGVHFSRITASSLLLVSHTGKVLAGGLPTHQIFNSAAFVIHSAIHAARPDVNAIVHAHTPYGKAFSTLGRELPFYSQDSAVFYNDIALYASHGGIVLDSKESAAILGAMSGKKACILQNHGILTVGGSIESAVCWFMLLENECRAVMRAEAAAALAGKLPISLSDEVAEYTWKETGTEAAGYFEASGFFDLVEEECAGAHKR